MRILALILLIAIGTLQAQSKFGDDYIFASDNFVAIDKQYHFLGGFAFAPAGYLYALQKYNGNRSKAIWTGVALGTSIGVVKEFTDRNTTGFNTDDLVWTFAGSVVSSWLMDKIHYPNYVKQQKKKIAELEAKRLAMLTDEEKLIEIINKR